MDIAMFVAKRLSTLDSVISTATHFVLTRYKDSGMILCDDGDVDERGGYVAVIDYQQFMTTGSRR